MGAKSSKKSITKKAPRTKRSPVAKKANKRATKKKVAKYSESGAPWWKTFLPS